MQKKVNFQLIVLNYVMPLFLDAHSMNDFDEETLQKAQNSPIDEFGVKHQNILYNAEADKIFCLLFILKFSFGFINSTSLFAVPEIWKAAKPSRQLK